MLGVQTPNALPSSRLRIIARPRPVSMRMQPQKTDVIRAHEAMRVAAYWYVKINDTTGLGWREKKRFHAWLKQSPNNLEAILTIVEHDRGIGRRHSLVAILGLAEEMRVASRRDDAVGRALSSSYLERLLRDDRPAKWALGTLSVLILGAAISICPPALPAAAISTGFLAAVVLKEAVVRHRVSRGLFGNTVAEARALLRFVLEHSASIDFNDPNGKQRPAFEPEVRDAEKVSAPVGAIAE